MSVKKSRGLKILTLALIAIFALATAFGFAACGGESDMTDKDASKLNEAVQNTVKYDEDVEDEANQSVTVEITYIEGQTLSGGAWSGGEEAKITYSYNDIYSLVYYKIEEGGESVEMYVRNKSKTSLDEEGNLILDEEGNLKYDYYATEYCIDENGDKSIVRLESEDAINESRMFMADALEMSGLTLAEKTTVSAWESEFRSLVGADGSAEVESKVDGNEYSFAATSGGATYSETIGVKSKKITSVDIVEENGSTRDEIVTTISYSYDADLAANFDLLSDKDANGEGTEEELWLGA